MIVFFCLKDFGKLVYLYVIYLDVLEVVNWVDFESIIRNFGIFLVYLFFLVVLRIIICVYEII